MKTVSSIVVTFIVFISGPLPAQGVWTPQISGTSNYLEAVHFTDALTGTAVGRSSTILHTTDGGETWTKQTSGTSNSFYDVCFTDAATGTAVGSNGTIVRTTDGGATWTSQTSGTSAPLNSVSFSSENIGTVVGSGGIILRTSNGGNSWTSEVSGTPNDLLEVQMLNDMVGVAVGYFGTILRTADGAKTWTPLVSGTSNHLYGLSFTDGNTGTVVGMDNTILRTTNGGVSWTKQTSGTSSYFYSVSFVDENIGTISGLGGVIFRTTDGGTHWENEVSNTAASVTGVHFLNAETGWAVASNGMILKYGENAPAFNIDFTADTLSGPVPLTVQFTDLTTGTPTEWRWFFGDGDSSVVQNPSHTYVTPGVYDVSLAASNATNSGVVFKTQYIHVQSLGDQYEPNNTHFEATQIWDLIDTLSASIDPESDLDFYTFKGMQGDSVDIYVTAAGSDLDGKLILYDEAVNVLESNDDYGDVTQSRISRVLPATGQYYIRYAYWNIDSPVSAADAKKSASPRVESAMASTGTYEMYFTQTRSGSVEPSGEGKYFSNAVNIFPTSEISGECIANETMVYRIDIPDDGNFLVMVNNPEFLHSASLFHADTVTKIKDFTLDSTFHLLFYPGPGTYYLTFHPSVSVAYSFVTTYVPTKLPADPEPNQYFADALPYSGGPIGPHLTGHVGYYQPGTYSFDLYDLWSFTVLDHRNIVFMLDADSVDAVGNRVLIEAELLNSDTTTIFRIDNTLGDTHLELNEYLLPGKYFVKIKNQGTAAGSFSVNIAGSFFSASAEDVEPNGVFETATPLPFDAPIWGDLGYIGGARVTRDQADYWKFIVPDSGHLTVNISSILTTGLYSVATGIDVDLYGPDFMPMAGAVDSDDTDDKYFVEATVAAGTYFLRVINNYEHAAHYEVRAEFVPSTTPTDDEPNDYWIDAGVLPLNGKMTGSVGFLNNDATDNVDCWKVTIPSYGVLTVQLHFDSLQANGSRVYMGLEFWDVDTSTFLGTDASDDDVVLTAEKHLAPGTYYIKVAAYSSAGSYELFNLFHPAFRASEPEPNNFPEQAVVMDVNASADGLIGYYGNLLFDNVDWWKFSNPQNDSLFVTFVSEQKAEVLVEIYDSSQNMQSFAYTDTVITLGIKAMGESVYFVKIVGLAHQFGSYQLFVSTKTIADQTPPAMPMRFEAFPIPTGIRCSWMKNIETDLLGYRLYYGFADSMEFHGVDALEGYSPVTTTDTLFTLTGLNPSKRYIVAVTAVDSTGNESGFSMIQFITPLEGSLLPSISIRRIWDVPNDNGKQVFISWITSKPAALSGIATFAVWYWLGDSSLWVNVKENIQSLDDTVFTTIVPTVYDSTISSGMSYSIFKISAHTPEQSDYMMSAPDSGYSLDNLYPAMPDSISGTVVNHVLVLQWTLPADDDFRYVVIYRDTTENVDIQTAAPIAVTTGTQWTDSTAAEGKTYFYRIAAVDWSGNRSPFSPVKSFTIVSVRKVEAAPVDYALEQNYPNPFNPSTTITYQLPEHALVSLKVYDLLGKEVITLVEQVQEAGRYTVPFNASSLASGIYFYTIRAGEFSSTKKLMLMK